MKIGEVARVTGVSIDTIRYYIELGILVPERGATLFDFDSDDLEDLRWTARLKQMGFSLKEIGRAIALRRISSWADPRETEEYLYMLYEQKKALAANMEELERSSALVEEEIDAVSKERAITRLRMGVPLRAMEYLCCPHCGASFAVENVQMNSRYLYSGRLVCACGYGITIDDGVAVADGPAAPGEPDLARDCYRDLPANIITLLQKSYNFMLHRLTDRDLSGRVVLETDINEFFFLYTHFRKLEHRVLYVVTDRYPALLRMYKERIELLKLDLDILFLADPGGRCPLRAGCVDVLVDYFSSNARLAREGRILPEALEHCLRPGGVAVGTFFYAEGPFCSEANTAVMRKLPEGLQYKSAAFEQRLSAAGWRVTKDRRTACAEAPGSKNAKKWLYLYEAERKK